MRADRYLKRFFSPSEYENGRRAGIWACIYVVVTFLVIVNALADGNDPEADTSILALGATLPLSLVVVTAHGPGMLAVLAVCALVNAFVFWVIFRGSAHYRRHDQTFRA